MQKLNHESTITLKNGVVLPVVGFGTYKLKEGDEAEHSIKSALEAGYRMIDTASIYKNEPSVARAITSYGLLREEVFITTKLWNADQGYENTLKAIDESLKNLNVSFVDLYLVHWPTADADLKINNKMIDKRQETWRAMEEIYKSGKARAIGVSNFTVEHLKEMEKYANVMPMVNQVEFHPFLYQKELLEYCRLHGIVVEAYAPLTQGNKLTDERITTIAKKHSKPASQVLLRWSLQHGMVPLPRSAKPDHIIENIQIFDFELDMEDMNTLDSLNENLHFLHDPYKLV
ncbi:MAG: aldo/keto reductase [Candidatus Pacebacteria bacterium]|nr:aldo/keto reductase [Candidatus Paceibacterota bacterium]MBP9851275.1 aldo/keto reductase [Candidatus Paceibacterota bacterium]